MTKISIIHFQPLEKYPPVMNLINELNQVNNINCKVYTTRNKNKSWFSSGNTSILRFGMRNELWRYWLYIKFNILVLFDLIIQKPKIVIAFETYSVFPIYFYRLIFKKSVAFIHYHEYISSKELVKSSAYYKFLNFIERVFFNYCNFISQTNLDRLNLFLRDYPQIKRTQTLIVPNLPPLNWFNNSYSKGKSSKVTKLIHIGALSNDTMHTREMLEWVIMQNGRFSLDFYTDNITLGSRELINNLNCPFIKLHGPVNYFELPHILANYDIGITLYNGHIPNYVYNVPNKIFEYLACGLEVWYSKDLISTHNLNANNQQINDQENIPEFLSKLVLKNDFIEYYDDNILIKKILQHV
jgi:hypothetical protein